MHQLFDIPSQWNQLPCVTQQGKEDITYADIGSFFPEQLKPNLTRNLVLCLGTCTAAYVAGFLALEQIGAVPIVVGKTSYASMESLITTYQVNYCWIPAVLSEPESSVLFAFREYVLVKVPGQMQPPLYEDLALLLATSGSTGSQKMVRLSRTNIQVSNQIIHEMGQFVSSDVGLVYLPVEHCFTIGMIHALFSLGARIVCAPNGSQTFSDASFIDREKISVLITVTLVIRMLKNAGFFDKQHPSIRMIANGAGGTPASLQLFLVDYLKKNNGILVMAYGQTELTIGVSAVPQSAVGTVFNSIGVPFGDVHMQLENVDETGAGNLIVRSGAVMLGYAQSAEDLAHGSDTGGILDTGDIARQDANGLYYLVGRAARFAKINGTRYSLDDISVFLQKEYGEDKTFVCISNDKEIRICTDIPIVLWEDCQIRLSKKYRLHPSLFRLSDNSCIQYDESGKILYGKLMEAYYDE